MCRIAFLSLIVLAVVCEAAVPHYHGLDVSNDSSARVKRQDSTTPKAPPKRRPTNIFRLFSTLLAETRDDTRRAFSDIGKLFNSQFTAPTSSSTSQITSSTTAASIEDGDDVSTTTEPYRISRDEFNGILRNNIRGIVRLLRQELGNAFTDSGKNIRDFGRELRTQIRPYVEIRNGRNNTSSS